MKRKLLLGLAALTLSVGAMTAQSPKRELRSTWLTTVWAIDWPKSTNQTEAKESMIDMLDKLEAQNYTGVCFQVRGLADAMYKSSYEPWNSAISGTRGKDPGWDPLEFVVAECHKRGMECYAWVNPYRISSNGNGYSTSYDKEWKEKGWYLSNGSYIVFNPGMKECREHILKVSKDIYTNYAIDGMLFDDYFYPSGGTDESASAPDYELYKASGTSLSIGDWRRKNVNDFMKEIYDNIQNDRPDIRFGLSPAGVAEKSASKYGLSSPAVSASDWQYDKIYSDPLAWLADGAVDFISPQLYWTTNHSTAPFEPLTTWWSATAEHFGRHFYPSHSISFLASANYESNWAEVATQVELHREHSVGESVGSIYYSTKNINGDGGGVKGLGDYLGKNVYQNKSLVPRMTWKEHVAYPAPSGLSFSGNTLNWLATEGEGQAIIRYSIYAIPTSVLAENAMSQDGDGIDGQYLVGVSYEPSFELPNEKVGDFYYAVCVYDGYGFESEPAYYGESMEPSAAATLISPVNGQDVEWTANFSWNKVGDATYGLVITSDAELKNALISQSNISTTSVELDLSKLKGETLYYWYVISTEPGKASTKSEAATFTTASRPTGDYESGYYVQYDPAEYEAAAYTISNLWMRSSKDNFANFPTTDNGTLNRGMVATKDYVYLSGRIEADSKATIYLRAYHATTGEHIHDLILGTNGQCSYLPCNDVIKDSEGNICISNLVLNSSTTALNVHLVNTETGELTEVASLTTPVRARIDHLGIYGDVTSGEFTVFAAAASGTVVYRWYVSDGEIGTAETMTIPEYYPSSTSSSGIAPRVNPISEDLFYLDGANTTTALYDYSTGEMVDCPAKGSALATTAHAANGNVRFTFNDENFLVYAATDHESSFSFNIAKSSSDNILSEGTLLWNVPKDGLGSVNSTTTSAPCDAVVLEDEVRVYVYSPGNGISAYSIALDAEIGGIKDVVENSNRMTIYSNVVTFAKAESFIKAYNFAGILVASAQNSDELALPGAGSYIIVTPNNASKVAIR